MTWRLGNNIRLRLQTGLQLWDPKLMARIYIYIYRAWENTDGDISYRESRFVGNEAACSMV
jgi:hypothetical protein